MWMRVELWLLLLVGDIAGGIWLWSSDWSRLGGFVWAIGFFLLFAVKPRSGTHRSSDTSTSGTDGGAGFFAGWAGYDADSPGLFGGGSSDGGGWGGGWGDGGDGGGDGGGGGD